jgi:hypothetical protein
MISRFNPFAVSVGWLACFVFSRLAVKKFNEYHRMIITKELCESGIDKGRKAVNLVERL